MKKKLQLRTTKTKRERNGNDLSINSSRRPSLLLHHHHHHRQHLQNRYHRRTERTPQNPTRRTKRDSVSSSSLLDASNRTQSLRTHPLPQHRLLIHPLLLQNIPQIAHAVIALSIDRRELVRGGIGDVWEHSFEEGERREGGFEVCEGRWEGKKGREVLVYDEGKD